MGDTMEEKQGDALLIELVEKFPCLYNKQLKEYRNNSIREAAWIQIVLVMNMLPSECSKRWGQLRESFGRENRRREEESKSGSGLSQRQGFSLYNDMKFLEPHYQKRRTFSNVAQARNKTVVHRFNTRPDYNYTLISSNATNDIEARGQYIAACIAKSFENVEPPGNAVTTQFGDATPSTTPPDLTPLTPPPDLTPAAISSLATVLPSVTSTPVYDSCNSLQTTPSTETMSVIDLHPVANASASSSLTAIPHSPTMSLSSSPAEMIIPISVPQRTIQSSFPSPVTSTPPRPMTTPTPPQRTLTPVHYSASPTTSTSTSINVSNSPISLSPSPSPSPTSVWPISDQFTTTSNCSGTDVSHFSTIPSRSNTSYNRISPEQSSLPTTPHALRSQCVTEPSACYSNKLGKKKKIDPVESSFLRLSSVIEDHLTNRMTVEETKKKKVAPRGDEAFMSLVLAELADLDEEKKAAKKSKILQVLYEN